MGVWSRAKFYIFVVIILNYEEGQIDSEGDRIVGGID